MSEQPACTVSSSSKPFCRPDSQIGSSTHAPLLSHSPSDQVSMHEVSSRHTTHAVAQASSLQSVLHSEKSQTKLQSSVSWQVAHSGTKGGSTVPQPDSRLAVSSELEVVPDSLDSPDPLPVVPDDDDVDDDDVLLLAPVLS